MALNTKGIPLQVMHEPPSVLLLSCTVLKDQNKQFLALKPTLSTQGEKLPLVPHSNYEKDQHAP